MDQSSTLLWRAELTRQLAGATNIVPLRRNLLARARDLKHVAELSERLPSPISPSGRQLWCKGAALPS